MCNQLFNKIFLIFISQYMYLFVLECKNSINVFLIMNFNKALSLSLLDKITIKHVLHTYRKRTCSNKDFFNNS